jgi:hypothetical protein
MKVRQYRDIEENWEICLVSVKSVILWIVSSCIVLEICGGFGGTSGFPLENTEYTKLNFTGTTKRTSDSSCGVLCFICGEIIEAWLESNVNYYYQSGGEYVDRNCGWQFDTVMSKC